HRLQPSADIHAQELAGALVERSPTCTVRLHEQESDLAVGVERVLLVRRDERSACAHRARCKLDAELTLARPDQLYRVVRMRFGGRTCAEVEEHAWREE
ncbi:MAG: hypothetical protein JNK04_14595, partial [Myxococcales bacterium]|nr:hypothetical protein [Myxococcales bacterium]